MKGTRNKNKFYIFFILLGAFSGTIIGEILGAKFKMLEFLKIEYSIGTPRMLNLDLKVLSLSFGLNFNVNFMTIVGIILAIIICRKY